VFGRLLGICILTLFLAGGCSRSAQDRKEIMQVLAIRTDALNSRDLTRYISVISGRYNDKGKSLDLLRETLEKNFRDFEQISYEAEKPDILVDGTRARSDASYRMKIKVRGKEMTLNGTEHLILVKEPEGWKIIAGI
jgi:predicted ester cyclase